MLQSGDQIIPGFKLEEFLGRGEFGQVWRAESPGGTHVALKFLDLRQQQGQKEFRAVQRIKGIRHPNLVTTYAMWLLDDEMNVIEDAAFEDPGSSLSDSLRGTMVPEIVSRKTREPQMLVIATALCDQNLMQRMDECRQQSLSGIPNDELLGYMADAAKAIDFLNAPRHRLGEDLVAVHHCDIKPANIMLIGGSAVVGDLGVARVFAMSSEAVRATSVCGSVAYSAPEMFENRTESTTDQYSLAITYYELRTGKLPLAETSFTQMVHDKASGQLNFEEVSPSERTVLKRATAVQPSQRYSTATEFVNALSSSLDAIPADRRLSVPVRSAVAVATTLVVATVLAFFALNRNPLDDQKSLPPTRPDQGQDPVVANDEAIANEEAMAIDQRSDTDAESSAVQTESSKPENASSTTIPEVAVAGTKPSVTDTIESVAGPKSPLTDGESPANDETSVSESSFSDDLEKLVAAFRPGEPTARIQIVGSDSQDWESGMNPAGFSTSPDGRSIVKSFRRELYLQSLADEGVRHRLDIDNLESDIRHIAWTDDGCMISDDQNAVWHVALDANPFHGVDTVVANRMHPESESVWIEVPNKSGVLAAARSPEDESDRPMPDSYLFDVQLQRRDAMESFSALSQLPARTWPPIIHCDETASRLIVSDRDTQWPGTFLLFHANDQRLIDLSQTAANELASIAQVTFLNDGQSLLLLGSRFAESWNSIYWIREEENQTTTVRRLSSELGEPVLLKSDGHSGFLVLRADALTHCIRAENQWVEREITIGVTTENFARTGPELSQSTISDFVVARRRWLLLVTEDSSLIAAKLYDTEATQTAALNCFELSWQHPTGHVAQLDLAGNYLIATTERGTSTWYQLDQLLLTAEMRLRVQE